MSWQIYVGAFLVVAVLLTQAVRPVTPDMLEEATGTLIRTEFIETGAGWFRARLIVDLGNGEETRFSLPINVLADEELPEQTGRQLTIRYQPGASENASRAVYALQADGEILYDFDDARRSHEDWETSQRGTTYFLAFGGIAMLAWGARRWWRRRREAANETRRG